MPPASQARFLFTTKPDRMRVRPGFGLHFGEAVNHETGDSSGRPTIHTDQPAWLAFISRVFSGFVTMS